MKPALVLPKFKLPGAEPNWTLRALWMAGGTVVLMSLIATLVFVKKQAADTAVIQQALQQQKALVATAATPARGGTVSAENAAPATAPGPAPAVEAAPAGSPSVATAVAPARPSHKAAKAKGRHASSRRGKLLAAKSTSARKGSGAKVATAGKSNSKSDEIDDLLRRFK